ncbi:MAG: PIN domain-containing protein [Defluviitaleaceae bacterium]|nr:PIN domain-containing protein [Defluviitaleaceae bacterium]
MPVFLDTNVLVYLYSNTESQKRDASISLFKKYTCVTSTQALNEFCNVYIQKYKISSKELKKFIGNIIKSCDVRLVTEQIIIDAINLNNKYGYSYYDCLILASALDSNCNTLFSEDLHNGQTIESKLKITNPFTNLPTQVQAQK